MKPNIQKRVSTQGRFAPPIEKLSAPPHASNKSRPLLEWRYNYDEWADRERRGEATGPRYQYRGTIDDCPHVLPFCPFPPGIVHGDIIEFEGVLAAKGSVALRGSPGGHIDPRGCASFQEKVAVIPEKIRPVRSKWHRPLANAAKAFELEGYPNPGSYRRTPGDEHWARLRALYGADWIELVANNPALLDRPDCWLWHYDTKLRIHSLCKNILKEEAQRRFLIGRGVEPMRAFRFTIRVYPVGETAGESAALTDFDRLWANVERLALRSRDVGRRL